MSAAPKFPAEFGYAGLRMTADEYLSLGETVDRYELIDGVVIMSPSPTPRHQRVAFLIAVQIEQQSAACGARMIPDVDVRLTAERVYRPDIVVYTRERMPSIPDRLTTAPNLVVEVLSPGSEPMDYITKRDDYERFGVGEYWVIDPREVSARAWRRSGVTLVESNSVRDTIEATSVAGLRVDLGTVRRAADLL